MLWKKIALTWLASLQLENANARAGEPGVVFSKSAQLMVVFIISIIELSI
jgi:hypothetical protein